ncbi:MAG: gluconokinase [Actinomycetota bacterium]|nr:gluconokinase [Actinomycetota bacterium]
MDAGSTDLMSPVLVAVDIGTTATKAIVMDRRGRQLSSPSASATYPLRVPEPGHAVQDPAEVLAAVATVVREVVSGLGGRRVAGLSFSSAMHGLIGLTADGVPLTPLLTWADTRATDQADRLRAGASGEGLHRRTGTPVHPMSPLVKLVWFHEFRPALCARVHRWAGIKEYVLLHLTGAFVSDHSVASATGLLDSATLTWDTEALDVAGVRPEQLPELVPVTRVIPGLLPEAAERLRLPAATPVVVGGSDGPLANLGVGAVRPGVAACSIGTSGALRVTLDRPVTDPSGGLFCYSLTRDRWVVGGAVNNGGVVLQWAGDALAPELGSGAVAELAALAERAPAGSGGLLMLPYLLGERAPHWSALPRGAYVGLTRAHRRKHLVRAALEGVCLQLALVLGTMRAAGIEIDEIRATGGFTRSPFWRQLLSDVLGTPVSFPTGHEGSGFGAGLVGLQALGMIPSVEVASDLVAIESVAVPDPDAAAVYAALLPVFSDLYDALVPTYTELRRLAPLLGT